jgi:hypothetical protein
MRKLLLCTAACLLLAACGAITSRQAIPTPTPTPSLQGIWTTTTHNDHQTVVLSIQAVGDQYVAASPAVAYDCLDFASVGGLNYPQVLQYQSPTTVQVEGATITLILWLFSFDASGSMHEQNPFNFVGQLTSPTTLEITTSGGGTLQTLVLHTTTIPAATIITNAINSYNKKAC